MNEKYMFIVGALMAQFSLSQMVYSEGDDPDVELPFNDVNVPVVGSGVQFGLLRRDLGHIVRTNWQADYSFITAHNAAPGVIIGLDDIVVPNEDSPDGIEGGEFDGGFQINVRLTKAERDKQKAEIAIFEFEKRYRIQEASEFQRIVKNYRNIPNSSLSETFRRYAHRGASIRHPIMNAYYNRLRQYERNLDFEN